MENTQSMNRMERIFKENKEKGKHSLVLYFPIGDTILGSDVEWAGRYFNNGVDVLEIGLPYEEPSLDGPSVKHSMERALKVVNLEKVFSSIKEIRKAFPNNILQIMTYFGNIEKYGIERFAEICHECGVDGMLSPDAPKEKLTELDRELSQYNIFNLRFVPYNLTDEIIVNLKNKARGYIFQQAVNGATGPQKTVDIQVKSDIQKIKAAGVTTPVFAGFGINDAKQAAEVLSMGADGVIVGSATINHVAEGNGEEYIKSLSRVM